MGNKIFLKVQTHVNESVKKKLEDMSKSQLRVGFLDSKSQGYPDGTSVVKVAMQNEFGARVEVSQAWRDKAKRKGYSLPKYWNIPARPFFRSAMDKNHDKYGRIVKTYLNGKGMAAGKSPDTFLNMLGSRMQLDVMKSIDHTYAPENSELTIRIKESSHPLIDTGHMRQSVNWEVKDKDA